MDTVGQLTQAATLPETEPHSSQVFVDASGRRARRLTRCGYLLGLGCVGYIGMVALGLSGTRVAALPGVPTSAENEIIAGLSGQAGSVGLHLTRTPVATPGRTQQSAAGEAHAAAVRAAAARAALSARAALAKPRLTTITPATARPVQPGGLDEQILAEGGTPNGAIDPEGATETKSQEKSEKAQQKADEKAEKIDSKHSKHGSADELY